MNRAGRSIGAALTLALGATVTGVYVGREAQGAKREWKIAQTERVDAERRLAELRVRAKAAEQSAAVGASEAAGAKLHGRSAEGKAEGRPAAASGDKTEKITLKEAMFRWQEENKRPEVQVGHLARQRQRHRENFRPFHRARQMDDETAKRFDSAYAKRDERESDLNLAMAELGLTHSDPAVGKLHGEIYKEHDQEVRALLGEEGYEALKEYRRTVGLRDVVKDMSATATVAGAPLTPAQLEQVIALMASESPPYARGRAIGQQEVNWAAVIEKLPQFLSPEQVTAVMSESNGGLFHARWNAELVRAMKPAAPK